MSNNKWQGLNAEDLDEILEIVENRYIEEKENGKKNLRQLSTLTQEIKDALLEKIYLDENENEEEEA
jgi:hypothetical protein